MTYWRTRVGLVLATVLGTTGLGTTGLATPANAVIGGRTVSSPPSWAAYLTITKPTGWLASETSVCTGALVSARWVVTAAHCVAELVEPNGYKVVAPRNVSVEVGRKDRRSRGTTFKVNRIELQNYRSVGSELDDDIALLQLARESTAAPLWILPSQDAAPDGTPAVLYGYGHSVPVSDPTFERDEVGILRRTNQAANSLWLTCPTSTHGRACIRDTNRSYGGAGDSGGPWVVTIDGKPLLSLIFTGYVLDGAQQWAYGEAVADSDTLRWLRSTSGIPNLVSGQIVRNPANGKAWLVDAQGFRRSIPDGGTYRCLVNGGARVVNLPRAVIDNTPARTAPATCGGGTPAPGGLTTYRTSGRAGMQSYVSGVNCPEVTTGTMFILTQGAGESNYGGWYTVFSYPNQAINVGTSLFAEPGTHQASVACKHSPNTAPFDGEIVKTYTFQQTVTGPPANLAVSPATAGPGATLAVGDGAGCGAYATPAQYVNVEVFDMDLGGSSVVRRSAPVAADGHWEPVSLPLPADRSPATWKVIAQCWSADPSAPDQSAYFYPEVIVPAT